MKFAKCFMALCLVVSLLVGCGKPSNVSEDVYNLGLKAVEVTEQFLSADLTADEAQKKLEEIEDRILDDDEYSDNVSVRLRISLTATHIGYAKNDATDDEIKQVKDDLETLEKILGK